MGYRTTRRQLKAKAERDALHPCFICGRVAASPDKEPPYRCQECFWAVAANAADGEL